jgi:hypothetical protein
MLICRMGLGASLPLAALLALVRLLLLRPLMLLPRTDLDPSSAVADVRFDWTAAPPSLVFFFFSLSVRMR